MTKEVWLILVLVVRHRELAVLLLNRLCASIKKTICPSDSFHLEKKNHDLSVLSGASYVFDKESELAE